jgi:U3 small nucleolar RNA-associated protein 18
VVAAGRRDYFYVYDLARGAVERVAPLVGRPEKSLESFAQSPDVGHHKNDPMLAFLGADGHVPLVSLKSRTCVGAVKMNGSARSAAFAADGVHLLTAGGDSTTYVWDLRNQKRCVEKIVDDGALTVTALAASPSGAHVAFGSESGVVNVYDTRGFRTFGSNLSVPGDGNGNLPHPTPGGYRRETRPTPLRALMNLTTSADALTFNGDGQMLAMSSRLKRDSLRLVHLPSCTVFSNWPSSKTPLHYVWCTAFSPTGGYLAVGNARGKALLYRIHAYGTGGKDE